MVVAAPVEDARGRLLLPAGEVIQESVISVLTDRGVAFIHVSAGSGAKGPADAAGETELDEDARARLEDKFLHYFERYEGQELYEILKRAAHAHLFAVSRSS